MKHSFFCRKKQMRTAVFTAFAIALAVAESSAQTIIATEGFNNATTAFTTLGGAFFTGSSAAGDRPANSPFAFEGTHGYGVSNGSAVATSNPFNTTNFSDVVLSFRLASFSVNSTGNGHDLTDSVLVEVSPDNGTTFFRTLAVFGGPSTGTNSFYPYTGTADATTGYDGDASIVSFSPASGGAGTTPQYSLLRVTDLPSVATLIVRITAKNNGANERWVIDSFNLAGTSLPLSINVVSFDAQKKNTNVQLTWATNCGSIARSFSVEKCTDGGTFTPIAELSTRAEECGGNDIEYRHTDATGYQNRSLYRLAVSDASGQINYSRTVAVSGAGKATKNGITISPNPAGGFLHLQGAEAGRTYRIVDMAGRTLQTWKSTGSVDAIPVGALAPGMYVLVAEGSSASTAQRFWKQ